MKGLGDRVIVVEIRERSEEKPMNVDIRQRELFYEKCSSRNFLASSYVLETHR